MKRLVITHQGLDYATLNVDGEDFEIPLGLKDALVESGVEEDYDPGFHHDFCGKECCSAVTV